MTDPIRLTPAEMTLVEKYYVSAPDKRYNSFGNDLYLERYQEIADVVADFDPALAKKFLACYSGRGTDPSLNHAFVQTKNAYGVRLLSGSNNEIEQQVTQAPYVLQDDRARKIIRHMTEAELANVPIHTKTELLDALRTGFVSPADHRAIKLLYEAGGLDQAFWNEQLPILQHVGETLAKDPQVVSAHKDWQAIDNDERRAVCKKLVSVCMAAYGLNTGFEWLEEPQPKPGERFRVGGGVTQGRYHFDTKILQVNSNMRRFESFEDLLTTIAHELNHAYMHELVQRLNDGKLPESDPRFTQVNAVFSNLMKYIGDGSNAYEHEPIEELARASSWLVTHIFLNSIDVP